MNFHHNIHNVYGSNGLMYSYCAIVKNCVIKPIEQLVAAQNQISQSLLFSILVTITF